MTTDNPEAKKIRRSTTRETIAIGNLLEMHFDKQTGTYKAGWSDDAIAATVSKEIKGINVAYVRKELGFFLRHVSERNKNGQSMSINARLTRLEHRFTDLCHKLGYEG